MDQDNQPLVADQTASNTRSSTPPPDFTPTQDASHHPSLNTEAHEQQNLIPLDDYLLQKATEATVLRNVLAHYQQQEQEGAVTEEPQLREVWRSSKDGETLPQPDPNRVVIQGIANYRYGLLTSTNYTYADQLPCISCTMLVFVFLCFFIGTPASLLCSIPAWYLVNKANKEANEHHDIPAARDLYSGFYCCVIALSCWVVLPVVSYISLIILGSIWGL